MKVSRLVTSSLLVSFSMSPFAVAQDARISEMDPIVVTATLGPKTAGESLASVTVINEEEIRTKSPAEFSELLRGQPGINVVNNGAFGKATSIYTRGVKNAGTVFLVDGVKLHSATSGGASWQYFPTELVQRIELVRGPRSSLYGADAMGGVVQAFTLDPHQGEHGWLETGAGNFDTQKVSAGVAGVQGNTRFSLSGLHKETDGTAIVEDGEDRGFRNTAGVGRVVHSFSNGGEASMVLLQSEGNSEYEGGDTDYMIRTLGLGLNTPLNENWLTGIQFAESRDESDTFSNFGDSTFNTRMRQARWENTFTYDVHEWVVGTELQQDEVSATTAFTETSRTNTALFTQLRLNFGPADVQMSLRGDDNEAYGKKDTGGLALGYRLDQLHRIRASYGTAFRAPTFNDLYFPFTDYGFGFLYEGNPNLKPETSESYEVGIGGSYQTWFWDLAAYHIEIENLISSGMIGAVNTSVNVDEARIRGTELSAGYDSDGWRAAIALTYMDPEDRATGNQLARRTRQIARLDLDKTISDFVFGGSFIAEGHRYDDANNTDRLAGFGTLDLRAGWNFATDWNAHLVLANVLDKEYSTAREFATKKYIAAGRTGMLTVRYDIR
jgi:vitamin B12 transporter